MRRIPNHSADISLESSWFNKQSSPVYRDDHTPSCDNSLYCLDQLERLHRYHTNSLWPLIHFGLLLFYYWQFFSTYFLSLSLLLNFLKSWWLCLSISCEIEQHKLLLQNSKLVNSFNIFCNYSCSLYRGPLKFFTIISKASS